MQKKLLLLSCIEGGTVMAAELCGARLLAPVFGSSLYVWASVLGITLGALALGYFFGGYLSECDKTKQSRLFLLLNLAAACIMAMPIIAYYLVPRISYLPFLPAIVLSSLSLLFFPVFLLGASSPFFISLQTTQNHSAGKVSGTVYAVSTFGGILATFICGFWLIPVAGLNLCLITFGLLLFVSTLAVSKTFSAAYLLVLSTFLYLLVQIILSNKNTRFVCDGVLGRLEVKEVNMPGGDTLRYLAVNGIIQTEMFLHSSKKTGDYQQLLDTLVPPVRCCPNALLLGMGGGLSANILIKKNYNVDAVEIDERMMYVAKQFFNLNKNVVTIKADARYYLNHCEKKYRLVFFDVFKAEEQPGHVLTIESLEKLKKNLEDSAMVIINWHGYIKGENGKGTALLYNTLIQSGFKVRYCALHNNENTRNLLFVASLKQLPNVPYKLNDTIAYTNKVNTDNLQLMERNNAAANKKWRANYLRYYQRKNLE